MPSQNEILGAIRKRCKGKIIGFCSGGFDLTHPGHVLFFEDCKKHCDILVVSVSSDVARKAYKNNPGRPIWNEHLRLKMISSLKPVDYAFIGEHISDNAHPLDDLIPVFEELAPHRYVVNSDASDIPYRRGLSDRYGIRLIVLERTCPLEFDHISTTQMIAKMSAFKET